MSIRCCDISRIWCATSRTTPNLTSTVFRNTNSRLLRVLLGGRLLGRRTLLWNRTSRRCSGLFHDRVIAASQQNRLALTAADIPLLKNLGFHLGVVLRRNL